MSDGFSKHIADQLYAERMGLLLDEEGQAVLECLENSCAGPLQIELLSKRVRAHKIRMARRPFPDAQGLDEGNFVIGTDPCTDAPLVAPMEWMGCPGLIVGSTGSGKTNTAKFWALQMGLLCEGAWLIDCRKREMRSLAPLFQRANCSVSIIDVHSLKLNPLEVPEHASPQAYVSNISDGLVGSLALAPGARKIVHQTLYMLYHTHGMFYGHTLNYPTLFDLRDSLSATQRFPLIHV